MRSDSEAESDVDAEMVDGDKSDGEATVKDRSGHRSGTPHRRKARTRGAPVTRRTAARTCFRSADIRPGSAVSYGLRETDLKMAYEHVAELPAKQASGALTH